MDGRRRASACPRARRGRRAASESLSLGDRPPRTAAGCPLRVGVCVPPCSLAGTSRSTTCTAWALGNSTAGARPPGAALAPSAALSSAPLALAAAALGSAAARAAAPHARLRRAVRPRAHRESAPEWRALGRHRRARVGARACVVCPRVVRVRHVGRWQAHSTADASSRTGARFPWSAFACPLRVGYRINVVEL